MTQSDSGLDPESGALSSQISAFAGMTVFSTDSSHYDTACRVSGYWFLIHMYTLAIETSCDETAVAVLKDSNAILSNIVLSQVDLHKYFGGIVPELASRKHIEVLPNLVKDALRETGITMKDIQLIAVTQGPGLVGALLVGLSYAKALSYSLKIPVVGVNHIEAHLYANFMEHPELHPPCIGLVVSGGHTTLVEIMDIGKYRVLGQTLDDAAGEAFDKVAKLLGLGYPGGPIIDNLSKRGDPKAIRFPRAMAKQKNYDFSFSGLKTSVVYYVNPVRKYRRLQHSGSTGTQADTKNTKISKELFSNGVKGYTQYKKQNAKKQSIPPQQKLNFWCGGISTEDLVSSFQEAVVDQLIKKTIQALKDTGCKKIILGGGVSRNTRLRRRFQKETEPCGWKLYIPSPQMCTDNAAMIAGLGYLKYKNNGASSIDLDVNPRLGWNY